LLPVLELQNWNKQTVLYPEFCLREAWGLGCSGVSRSLDWQ